MIKAMGGRENKDKFCVAREQMLRLDLKGRDITNPDVLKVMAEVPREEFIPESYFSQAYTDGPLPIGMGQTISQPYIVALMTQELRCNRNCEVLEIGTGSGYQTAVLGKLVKKEYKLIISDDENKNGSFVAHLVKLEDSLFLDVFPDEFPCDTEDPNKTDWLYNVFFLVPVHTFIKIDSIEPQLKMRLTDDDKMAELLKEDPNAVEHTSIEDRLILTASTKELQAFVLEYADDNRVFTDEIVLGRK